MQNSRHMMTFIMSTREGEMGVYKLARITDRKCRAFRHVRCIKSEDQRV